MKFEKGDIVQVHYTSPEKIEAWMRGWETVGPGDVGVVIFSAAFQDWQKISGQVTVMFPMIGTRSIHSSQLKIVQKASEKS